MTHLINKYCSPREQSSTSVWERGRLRKLISLRPSIPNFFGCEADEFCLWKSMRSILEAFARQTHNNDSEINEIEDIHKAARRYLQVKPSAEEIRRKDVLRVPWRFYAGHSFQNHNVITLSQYFDDMNLFLYRKHLPSTVRCEKGLSRTNLIDVRMLLSHDCSDCGVHIKRSTIAHPQAGIGNIVNPKFTEGT